METKVNKVWIDNMAVYIETSDGKIFSEKFENYPRLRYATTEQRAAFEYNDVFIRWDELDEDLSIEGFMKEKRNSNDSKLCSIFKMYPELNVSAIARRVGISQSLMASYLCGCKKPSLVRENEIINTIRQIGMELAAM